MMDLTVVHRFNASMTERQRENIRWASGAERETILRTYRETFGIYAKQHNASKVENDNCLNCRAEFADPIDAVTMKHRFEAFVSGAGIKL